MLVVCVIGIVILSVFKINLNSIIAFSLMFVLSIGLGMIFPTSQSGLLKPFPKESAQANALANLIRFLPASIIGNVIVRYDSQFEILLLIAAICGLFNLIVIFFNREVVKIKNHLVN